MNAHQNILRNDALRDCIADVRFSRQQIANGQQVDLETTYLHRRICEFRVLWKQRHTAALNRYGWPESWK